MPLYFYHCPECDRELRALFSNEDSKKPIACTCGAKMKRNPKPATSRVVESLDNGYMGRRVERPAEITRLLQERKERPDD